MPEIPPLDPARSALILVDMQNDFCHPDGFYGRQGRDVSALSAAIAPCRNLLARARAEGVAVVFTRLVEDPGKGPMEARHALMPRRWVTEGRRLVPGTWGAEVVEELAPRPGEIVIDKPGYSAFAQTGLEPLLRARGIRTLLIAGVVSYACVLATAFSAFDSDFDVILVQDAAGSWNPRLGEDTGAIVDLLLGHAIAAEDLQFVPRKLPATDRERSA